MTEVLFCHSPEELRKTSFNIHKVLSLVDLKDSVNEQKNLHRNLTGNQTQDSLYESPVFCLETTTCLNSVVS